MWSLAVSEEVSVKQEPDTLSDQSSQFTDLQTLVPVSMAPLPSFTSDYPTITISELTSSPDSSCYHSTSLEHQASLARGRKRSNSGSSGSSANSASCGGQSRPAKARRRQPLSEEELYKQRNDGETLVCSFISKSPYYRGFGAS